MNEITLQMRELIKCMYRVYTYKKLHNEQRKTHVGFYELVSSLNESGLIENEMTVRLLNFYYVYEVYLYDKEESIPHFKEFKKQSDLLFNEIINHLKKAENHLVH